MKLSRSTLAVTVGLSVYAAFAPYKLAFAETPRFDEHGATFVTPDEQVKLELGGRLHTDFGAGGARSVIGEFPDPAGVRRFRIEPTLTFDRDWIAAFQFEPTNATTPVANALVTYRGMRSFLVTVGNFKEPFSLEQLISNNDITFMERSLADVFAPARNTGAAVGTYGERWTLSAGAFGGNINDGVQNGGVAGTARATFAPIIEEGRVLHLGIAGGYRALDRRPDLAFATTPESFLFSTSLVDTGAIDGARAVRRLGLEAAYADGPFRVQGEYVRTAVERERGGTLGFEGGYVYAAGP